MVRLKSICGFRKEKKNLCEDSLLRNILDCTRPKCSRPFWQQSVKRRSSWDSSICDKNPIVKNFASKFNEPFWRSKDGREGGKGDQSTHRRTVVEIMFVVRSRMRTYTRACVCVFRTLCIAIGHYVCFVYLRVCVCTYRSIHTSRFFFFKWYKFISKKYKRYRKYEKRTRLTEASIDSSFS